jgi:oligoendopeptidase F
MTKIAALLACLLLLSPAASADAPPAQDPHLVWDLTELYPTDAAWDAERQSIADALPGLAALKGTLGKDAASLAKGLRAISDVQRRLARLSTYASLKRDEDTRNATNQDRLQRVELLSTDFATATSFVNPEIIQIGAARIGQFVAAEPKLKVFAFLLKDTLRQAPHTLGREAENVLAAAGQVRGAPRTIYTLLANADLPWPTVTLSDGTKVVLDQSAYTKYRAVQNRADRKIVMDAFFGAMKQFEHAFGSTLYGQMKIDSVNAKVHKYPDVVTAQLDARALPVAVYDTLISEANAHLGTLHRYFRLRAKMLGVTDLHYYDSYPPLVKGDRKFSLDEAKQLTLEAVAPLGPDYVAAMKGGFDNRWMDAYPRPHKLSGAHMAGYAYDVHPYVLLNFNDDYESVTTIAHEWGHALHTVQANKAQPYATADYSIFVAEIASTFNENLLLQHMLDVAKTDDERLLYLGSGLENLRQTFFRQAMFAEFERAVHKKVDAGETLSGPELTKIYGDILKRYHGDAQGVMKIDDVDAIEWAYIPHFYTSFYVFQYATSIAASSLFSDSVIAKEPGALDRYLGLLRAGGSDYPYDLVKKAGVDLASPAPYRSISARMDHIMDQIEAIEAKRGKS